MSIRLRRLRSDWEAVERALRAHPQVQVAGTAGDPPQRYHIHYRVRGLVERFDGSLELKGEHTAEITLLTSYPRQPPVCRMLTPVFHPNIAPQAICIGDDWSAGESLVQLILRIGEMIAFQSYNVKSPLNGVAAKWVGEHLAELPIDRTPLVVATTTRHEALDASDLSVECAACGAFVAQATIRACASGHGVCGGCAITCLACGGLVCPRCEPARCSACGA